MCVGARQRSPEEWNPGRRREDGQDRLFLSGGCFPFGRPGPRLLSHRALGQLLLPGLAPTALQLTRGFWSRPAGAGQATRQGHVSLQLLLVHQSAGMVRPRPPIAAACPFPWALVHSPALPL